MDIPNAAFMIPRAMTQIVQEGIEPLLIGEKLLQKIQYKPGMSTIFPAVEPLRADMAGDGMDLPIYNINIGGAQSFSVQVQRHGLRLKIAKRFVDESAYPRGSGAGCGGRATRSPRHKEQAPVQRKYQVFPSSPAFRRLRNPLPYIPVYLS